MVCQKTCLFQEYVPLSRVLWLYGPTEQNASYCMSTLSCAHKNNIYTHSSRAASHKFCFSHLELHVHTYSLHMHVNKETTLIKNKRFLSKREGITDEMYWDHFSAVGNPVCNVGFGKQLHAFSICFVCSQSKMHARFLYVFQFDFSISLFSMNLFISCAIFVWILPLKYAEGGGQSSFYLLNKLVLEVLYNSNTENMRKTVRERSS